MQDKVCAEEEAAVYLVEAAPLLPEQDGKHVHTCAVYTQNARSSSVPGNTSASPWQGSAESGAREQEVCLTTFYLGSSLGRSSQDWHSERCRGALPALPSAGQRGCCEAGGSLLCSDHW